MSTEKSASQIHGFADITCNSAWWGMSFVNELTRISAQADKKLRVRRGSSVTEPNGEQRKTTEQQKTDDKVSGKTETLAKEAISPAIGASDKDMRPMTAP